MAFITFLGELRAADDVEDPVTPHTVATMARAKANEIRKQIAGVNQARERTWELYETSGIPQDSIKQRLAQHDESLRRLNEQLDIAEDEGARASAVAHSIQRVTELFRIAPRIWEKLAAHERSEFASLTARAVGGIRLTDDSNCRCVQFVKQKLSQSGYIRLQTYPLWESLAAIS